MEELDGNLQPLEEAPGHFGIFCCDPAVGPDLVHVLDGFVAVHRNHDLDIALAGLAVGEVGDLDDIRVGLLHPVEAGDPDVEVAFLNVGGDLLRAENFYFTDAAVSNAGIVIAVRAPDLKVGFLEELEGLRLEAALRECEGEHTVQHRCKHTKRMGLMKNL